MLRTLLEPGSRNEFIQIVASQGSLVFYSCRSFTGQLYRPGLVPGRLSRVAAAQGEGRLTRGGRSGAIGEGTIGHPYPRELTERPNILGMMRARTDYPDP